MAHYYFDVKNGMTERDHKGVDLDNDAQAIAWAHVVAEQIGDRPPASREHERHICIIHEDGHEVTRVPVAIERRLAAGAKKFS